MAFCAKCGAQLAAGATFCTGCGAAQGSIGGGASAAAGTGLDENVAGTVSYAGLWVTGLVFFLIDKRPFVRFHAAQSMVLFGAITVFYWVLKIIFGFGGFLFFGGFAWILYRVIWLACVILLILCMVKAYQNERFKLPVVGDIAENIAGK